LYSIFSNGGMLFRGAPQLDIRHEIF